eukprot:Gb_06235 [translate_table: standard]
MHAYISISGSVNCSPEIMANVCAGVVFIMLLQVLGLLVETRGDVYVVLMVDDPVVSYQGSIPGFPATAAPSGAKVDVTRNHVQLYKKYLIERHDILLKSTLQNGTYTKLYSLHHLLNGFVVDTSDQAVERLAGADGVRHIERDWEVQKMTTHTPDFLGIPTGVWPQLGGPQHSGEGVVIGMVDTGINPLHPSFSNSQNQSVSKRKHNFKGKCEVGQRFPAGSCNGKIISAQHFSKAAVASGLFNATRDYASPYDSNGHGRQLLFIFTESFLFWGLLFERIHSSHTASIAAGNYRVPVIVNGFNYGYATGMAPRAKIAVYKAIYSFGGNMADVAAAVDKAVEDGVDILSLSLGPSRIPRFAPVVFLSLLDIELLFALKAGVFVVQAAGNEGPYSSTVRSFSPWITTVAASLTDRSYNNNIQLGEGQNIAGIGLAPPTKGESKYKMVSAIDVFYGNATSIGTNTCQHPESYFNKDLVQGNLIICSYSYLSIASIMGIADTSKKLGAAGFVTIDPNVGPEANKDISVILAVPGIILTDINSSLALMEYYNASTKRDSNGTAVEFEATAKIRDGRVAVYSGHAPIVAWFSSRGPDVTNVKFQPADVLKPNIMAPGNLIWAAWSPSSGDYQNFQGKNFAMISGTSMATPHVAGIAALIKQKYPKWTPATIASAVMTTASTVDRDGNPILAQNPGLNNKSLGPASLFDYGAGAIDPAKAMDPGLVFDTDFMKYIGFICSVPGVDQGYVRNATGVACPSTIPLSSDLNTPSITVTKLEGSRHVRRTVKNVAGVESYNASIGEPEGVEVDVQPRSFTIRKNQSTSLMVILRAKRATRVFTFGKIVLRGDKGHVVQIPLAIFVKSVVGS